MRNEIPDGAFSEHPGLCGEIFAPVGCESCGAEGIHMFDIVGGTALGDLLMLDEEAVPVDTPEGDEYAPETGTVCPNCLNNLIEAKKMTTE